MTTSLLHAGLRFIALSALLAAAPAGAQQDPDLDVPFVPTRQETVEEMLRLAELDEDDLLYDLGSGDGRIVITAAKKYGVRGVGVDLDPTRIEEARQNAKEAGVEDKVRFVQGDLYETDFSEADVVTMYLLPGVNMDLRPRILKMEPGTVIVSHAFDMGDWKPDEQSQASGQTVYKWIVPADVAGTWEWQLGDGKDAKRYRVDLSQSYQEVSGSASVDGKPAKITEARLQGDELALTIQPQGGEPVRLTAEYDDGQLVGRSEAGGQVASAEFVAERIGGQTQG